MAFLLLLGVTGLVWVLRGVGLLTFIPGAILWVLVLLCILAAIVNTIR